MTGTQSETVPHIWPGLFLDEVTSDVRYSLRWLDPRLPGYNPSNPGPLWSEVWDLNNDGAVLGATAPEYLPYGSDGDSPWHHRITIWNPDPTIVDELPYVWGKAAFNDVGDIVEDAGVYSDDRNNRWEGDGAQYVDGVNLHLKKKLAVHAVRAKDINNRGIITGDLVASAGSKARAFVYNAKSGGPPTDFNLSRDGGNSVGWAINQRDHVLGHSTHGEYRWNSPLLIQRIDAKCFLYVDGGVIDLGNRRRGMALNDHDVVVGCRQADVSQPYLTAFALRADAATLDDEDLGALPGHKFSQANDINNHGDIVGMSVPKSSYGDSDARDGSAFVRLRNGSMQDLNDLIPPDSGWKLISALRINSNGQILCWGTGPTPLQTGGGLADGYMKGAGCLLSPETTIPAPFHDNFISDRFGLVGGTGWVFQVPGGRPVPINPNELWDRLTPEKRDIVLGLAMSELAGRVSDADARAKLENAARTVAKQAMDRWTD